MRFAPAFATKPETGVRVPLWIPDVYSTYPTDKREPTLLTTTVGGRQRVLLSRLVDIAVDFTRTLERRAQLGHDCAVFALACETGNLQAGTLFNQPGGQIVKIANLDAEARERQQEQEPVTQAGEISFTTSADRDLHGDLVNPHFLVHASADTGTPLYFSKLGTEGLVVLSTYDSIAELYDVTSAGVAEGFYTEAYRKPSP